MGKAKCKICGTVLDTNTAYCITKQTAKTKRNFYYCSEEEYNKDQERKKKEAKDYYSKLAYTLSRIQSIPEFLFEEYEDYYLKIFGDYPIF